MKEEFRLSSRHTGVNLCSFRVGESLDGGDFLTPFCAPFAEPKVFVFNDFQIRQKKTRSGEALSPLCSVAYVGTLVTDTT